MNKDSIIEYLENNLSEKRKIHTYAVRDTAIKLARQYGGSPEKAETAALFHDMFRGLKGEPLKRAAEELGLEKKYYDNPNLAHSKIAAAVMRRDYGIEDEDILNGVAYHTTGRAGMSLLEKIIYLADAIEPNRTYPGVEHLRKTAETDLDQAVLDSLSGTIDFIKREGLALDYNTMQARDYLLERKKKHDDSKRNCISCRENIGR